MYTKGKTSRTCITRGEMLWFFEQMSSTNNIALNPFLVDASAATPQRAGVGKMKQLQKITCVASKMGQIDNSENKTVKTENNAVETLTTQASNTVMKRILPNIKFTVLSDL